MHGVFVVGDFGFVAYRRVPGDYGKWNQRATDSVTTVSQELVVGFAFSSDCWRAGEVGPDHRVGRSTEAGS